MATNKPPPDPNAPEPSKPRSTPKNTPDQPSANHDQEWLQTSPPPDPPVPTPKRESRNRQSTDYHTPAAHIHVQVYGYPPAYNSHGGYHSNVYMDSDSEDSYGHYGDDASSGGYHSNGIDSDEYEFAGCNYYRGDTPAGGLPQEVSPPPGLFVSGQGCLHARRGSEGQQALCASICHAIKRERDETKLEEMRAEKQRQQKVVNIKCAAAKAHWYRDFAESSMICPMDPKKG
ncbi:hypothetical protein THAOC_23214, partial [Thalassiosira oceanica]